MGKYTYCGAKVKLGFPKFTFLIKSRARGFRNIDTPSKKDIAPPTGGYTLLLSDTDSILAHRERKGLLPQEQKPAFSLSYILYILLNIYSKEIRKLSKYLIFNSLAKSLYYTFSSLLLHIFQRLLHIFQRNITHFPEVF